MPQVFLWDIENYEGSIAATKKFLAQTPRRKGRDKQYSNIAKKFAKKAIFIQVVARSQKATTRKRMYSSQSCKITKKREKVSQKNNLLMRVTQRQIKCLLGIRLT